MGFDLTWTIEKRMINLDASCVANYYCSSTQFVLSVSENQQPIDQDIPDAAQKSSARQVESNKD
jgi:hypothetical protein